MSTPSRDQVETVLADLIREGLARSESTSVPGLGTFAVRHRSSSLERGDSGELIMKPPSDEIVFTPED